MKYAHLHRPYSNAYLLSTTLKGVLFFCINSKIILQERVVPPRALENIFLFYLKNSFNYLINRAK